MTDPFSRTALTAVIGVAAASLVVAVVLTIAGDDLTSKRSAGADAYSVSAIGHKGLVRLLEKLDVPVIVSRGDSADKAQDGLLIIVEPTVSDAASRERLKRLVDGAPQVLLVLPKWFGSTERRNAWIEDAHLLPVDEVTAVIDALGLQGVTLGRQRGPVAWELDDGEIPPVIREPQLMAGGLVTEVATGDGHLLLGRLERAGERYLHVLSDPDVLNNFGLRTPENARFTINLIDTLRDEQTVVIDETMHGYAQPPSLVRALLQFPLVLASLQVLVCAVIVVWAAMVRFGPRRAAPPPIAPGKDFLIRNTAALLQYGGHHAHALTRYLQLTVGAVRHALHAPALAPAAMTAWLERVRLVRGGTISLVELEQAVETADSAARTVEVADQVFRWRMEMTHGIDSRS
jgi:hypothetical protein